MHLLHIILREALPLFDAPLSYADYALSHAHQTLLAPAIAVERRISSERSSYWAGPTAHDNIYTLAMRQERDSRALSSQAAVHLPWRVPQRAERALSEVRTLLSRLQVAKASPHVLLWEHWMSGISCLWIPRNQGRLLSSFMYGGSLRNT